MTSTNAGTHRPHHHQHNGHDTFSLTAEDRFILANMRVPVPHNEQKRIETLRQSKILETAASETGFHRFTSLATRLFNMQFSAVSFVDVDRVFFKSKVGFEISDMNREEWFDAYTVLPESSEVYVIPDCTIDARFSDKPYVKGGPRIKFYAGAAIMIENVKIGVLSIMDTQPHRFFSLEDKENLLDLGAAAAQLAKEKLQTSLNLSAERANIVVSMMHHLRTPMTSLNFATSLLCNDVQHIKGVADNDSGSEATAVRESPPPSVFQAFESSFLEINTALNQLNILVDSSLSLGQAIIKCGANDGHFSFSDPHREASMAFNNNAASLQSFLANENGQKSKFSECNVIDYLTDMFHHHLPIHNDNLEIEWLLSAAELSKGLHVTFPDALMLIVISTVSHLSADYNQLGFYFSFEYSDEEDCEYPELSNKMLEGLLAIKVFAKDSRGFSSENPLEEDNAEDLPSQQNFLSIDKILRAINGSSREFVADINQFCKTAAGAPPSFRSVHEFCVPCKVLLKQSNQSPTKALTHIQEKKLIRFFRGKTDKTVTVTVETPQEDPTDGTASTAGSTRGKSNEKTVGAAGNAGGDGQAQAESTGDPDSNDRQGRVLRALVIEDTIPVQKLLTRWLQNHGCTVTCANNGKIGLDYLTSSEYDIAFVDFLMPVMLGITTMKLFQEWLKNPPGDWKGVADINKETLIIGMSATALESEQEEAFKFGMHFFCPKPVSLELLTVILDAKKSSPSNQDAVGRIFSLTGTISRPPI